jgi:ABC-type branched-subunit amino acid transport system ATPase component
MQPLAAWNPAQGKRRLTAFLDIRGLSKSFGGIHALRNLDLSIGRGEILGIAGPNGSGKSTFFNVMTKVPFGADRGEVLLEGVNILTRKAHEIARSGMARTFQRESVFASLSAVDNVLTTVEQSGTARSHRENVAAAIGALETAGFPATMHNTPAGALPVFLRKLVMIAAALALKPRVLLLDEPASSLTPHEIARIQALILKLRQTGMTILLIEHVLPLLTAVSDRLAVLDQGELIALGLPAAVIADPQVEEAYLGKRR